MVFFPKLAVVRTFFVGNVDQENVFYDILQPKNAFLGCKKKNSNSRKTDIVGEGLTHGFFSKNSHFSNFLFLGIIGQEIVFYDILEPKNTFLFYKKKKFQKSKN